MKIKNSFCVGNYTVVVFTDPLPHSNFRHALVNGEAFEIVPAYDIPNSIALCGKIDVTNANIQLV